MTVIFTTYTGEDLEALDNALLQAQKLVRSLALPGDRERMSRIEAVASLWRHLRAARQAVEVLAQLPLPEGEYETKRVKGGDASG